MKRLYSIRQAITERFIGQEHAVDVLLASFLLNGHCLITGVPGLAKTMLVHLTGALFDLSFRRVQFTPDLMPSDITGSEVLQEDKSTGERFFRFVKGPVFTNILLADEINRTPPKTQAALLEAMQEHRVTANGTSYTLDEPFIVCATRNPIEQEGTYPLPEAQLDRFLFSVNIGYPSYDDELRIIKMDTDTVFEAADTHKLSKADLFELQRTVKEIPVSDFHYEHILTLIRRTRRDEKDAPAIVKKSVEWGIGPRGAQNLVKAAKAFAYLRGSKVVERSHIDEAFPYVANHRLVLSFHAEAEQLKKADIINAVVAL